MTDNKPVSAEDDPDLKEFLDDPIQQAIEKKRKAYEAAVKKGFQPSCGVDPDAARLLYYSLPEGKETRNLPQLQRLIMENMGKYVSLNTLGTWRQHQRWDQGAKYIDNVFMTLDALMNEGKAIKPEAVRGVMAVVIQFFLNQLSKIHLQNSVEALHVWQIIKEAQELYERMCRDSGTQAVLHGEPAPPIGVKSAVVLGDFKPRQR